MIKKHLKYFWISLGISILLFLMSLLFDALGYPKLAMVTFFVIFPVFLFGYYHCFKYFYLSCKKIWYNLKNNKLDKDIFDLDND